MQLAATALQQKRRPIAHIGRLPIDAVDIQETAQAFIHYCLSAEREKAERPVYSSSVNGQVISLCARDRKLAQMFLSADSLNGSIGGGGCPMRLNNNNGSIEILKNGKG